MTWLLFQSISKLYVVHMILFCFTSFATLAFEEEKNTLRNVGLRSEFLNKDVQIPVIIISL